MATIAGANVPSSNSAYPAPPTGALRATIASVLKQLQVTAKVSRKNPILYKLRVILFSVQWLSLRRRQAAPERRFGDLANGSRC